MSCENCLYEPICIFDGFICPHMEGVIDFMFNNDPIDDLEEAILCDLPF